MANFTITENYGTYQGDTSYILDGNTNNIWRADAKNSDGKYVLITSDQLIFVSSVVYYTSNSSEIFGTGTYLQYSTDGSSFTDADIFTGNSGITLNVNAQCKYLRIYCKSGSEYVSISELTINYTESGGEQPTTGTTQDVSFTIASLDDDHSWYSASDTANPIGKDISNTSYARIYLTRGSKAETRFSYRFDCSSIPQNAIIKSVKCYCKTYINSTSTSYVSSRHIGLYSGNQEIGSGNSISRSTSSYQLNTNGNWTREMLNDISVKVSVIRGTSSTSSNYYVYFYAARLEVSYELPAEDESELFFMQINNEVVPVDIYLFKNNQWIKQEEFNFDSTKKYIKKY